MSVVKEQYSERYIERIEDAVDIHVDKMTVGELLEYTAQNMKDYYLHRASDKEVEKYLSDHEPLPF